MRKKCKALLTISRGLDIGFLTGYITEKVIGVFVRLVSIFIYVLKMMEGHGMGQGFTRRCMSCGDATHFLQGIGFRYFSFLQEVKEEIRAGKFGKEPQAFIIEYPECEFDARNEVYFCEDCKYLKQGVEINMSYGDKSFQKQYRCGKTTKKVLTVTVIFCSG